MASLLMVVIAAASVALALNIGANNSAAEMGPAYGAGVRTRRQSLVLIAVFCTVGALLAGGRVMHNVGHSLVLGPGLAGSPVGALAVILAAVALITTANALRVPLSTAHVVVGAVIGLGLFHGVANLPLAAKMIAWWIATPLASLALSYLLGLWVLPAIVRALGKLPDEVAVARAFTWMLTLSGCWMAFSAGSNSLAKAMGPAVGAGALSAPGAAVVGALGMAAGVLLFGGRLLNTVGKEITRICPTCAALVEIVSASIIFIASRFGMPVSLAEIVTCSVIGFGCAANGIRRTVGNGHVRRIVLLWPTAPVAAALAAFGLQYAIR